MKKKIRTLLPSSGNVCYHQLKRIPRLLFLAYIQIYLFPLLGIESQDTWYREDQILNQQT